MAQLCVDLDVPSTSTGCATHMSVGGSASGLTTDKLTLIYKMAAIYFNIGGRIVLCSIGNV